jgi:broad specificity phosphatase PhoE
VAKRSKELTTHLTLVCHASTSAVRTATFPAGEELDPQGQEKLAVVQHRLRHADRCWCSPALRTIQTADSIVEPMLRDCDHGRESGRLFDDVQAQEPEALTEWLRDPRAAPHGGESLIDLIRRVAAWLETQNGMRGKTVAVTDASVTGPHLFTPLKPIRDHSGASMLRLSPWPRLAAMAAAGPCPRSADGRTGRR